MAAGIVILLFIYTVYHYIRMSMDAFACFGQRLEMNCVLVCALAFCCVLGRIGKSVYAIMLYMYIALASRYKIYTGVRSLLHSPVSILDSRHVTILFRSRVRKGH